MILQQQAESFVFMAEVALPFRYKLHTNTTIVVRNHSSLSHPSLLVYEEGKDYLVDYKNNLIRRVNGGQIPDAALHPMYQVNKFDHTQYPDYSNREYTVYADYSAEADMMTTEPLRASDVEESGLLNRTIQKLCAGEEAIYVVYGDSISAGGEASEEALAYFGRNADTLRALYPEGRIRIVNKAINGESSTGGASRVHDDIIALKPDLVSIGYGMNDQNLVAHGNEVSLSDFEKNLRYMINTIRHELECDILLVTPCEPNPHWQHTSGDTSSYAETIRQLGQEYSIGVIDAHALWLKELAAGKTHESLLLNNINHPNDYGHWIYSKAFSQMLLKRLKM